MKTLLTLFSLLLCLSGFAQKGKSPFISLKSPSGVNLSTPPSTTVRGQEVSVSKTVITFATPTPTPTPVAHAPAEPTLVDKEVPEEPAVAIRQMDLNLSEDALAVVIGNQEYKHADVPPVEFAQRDAMAMHTLFTQAWGVREGNVIHYGQATLADMRRLFGTENNPSARLHNLVKPGKTDLILYYSGHGAPDLESGEPYLIPTDADPSLLTFTGYSLGKLYKNLSQIPFRRLIIILDACFSGGADSGSLLRDMSIVRIRASRPNWDQKRVILLTAGDLDQVATWNRPEQHSLFTYHLLKAFAGQADADQDGSLHLHELKTYLLREVPYDARRLKNRVQIPQVTGDLTQPIGQYTSGKEEQNR